MSLQNDWDVINQTLGYDEAKADTNFKEEDQPLPQYKELKNKFDCALEQAQGGKGKERHAKEGQYFEDQVMCEVQRLLVDHPLGGLAYQVIKKTIESGRLYQNKGANAALEDVYGAMNYLGGMAILYEEMEENQKCFETLSDDQKCSDCGGELYEKPVFIHKDTCGMLYCPNCDPIDTIDVGC